MNRPRRRLVASAVAAAALALVGLTATPAHAATVEVSGGPNVNFVGSSISFTDPSAGQTISCSTFDLAAGPITTGQITIPAVIADVSTLSSSGCINSFWGLMTITPTGTWHYQVDSATTGELTNINFSVSAGGCIFNVGGGSLSGIWNNSSHTFTPTSSTLTITDTPSGFLCPLTGWAQGDPFTVSGSWTNTPPSGSTQISIAVPPPPGSTVVSGGPAVNAVGNGVSFADPAAEQTLTCSVFNLAGGPITTGVITTPAVIADMSNLTSSGCTNPTAGATTVTPIGTWHYQVDSATTGELTNVNATVSAAGCTFNAGGGSVSGTWNNSTHTFTPTSSTLTITNTPSGFLCPLLGVAQGDPITVAGSWTNTPPAGSTQISISVT